MYIYIYIVMYIYNTVYTTQYIYIHDNMYNFIQQHITITKIVNYNITW